MWKTRMQCLCPKGPFKVGTGGVRSRKLPKERASKYNFSARAGFIRKRSADDCYVRLLRQFASSSAANVRNPQRPEAVASLPVMPF